MQVLVLAGGLGTRMRPHTDRLPKALLPVAGRPFAERQVELLVSQGVDDIVFSIAYRGDMIREALGDGRRWGVQIRYIDEGERRRGTGGAVRLFASSTLADEAFAVLYGDSYLPIDYPAVWHAFEHTELPALMTVIENRGAWDTSNAQLDADGRVRYHKGAGAHLGMTYIDYGLSVLEAGLVLEHVPADSGATTVDLADLFRSLGERGQLAGHVVHDRFYEVGSAAGLDDLEQFLARTPGAVAP